MSQEEEVVIAESGTPLVDIYSPTLSIISTSDNTKAEQSISTDDQLRGYAQFLDRLKHPSATQLVERVKAFVARLSRNLSRDESAEKLHRFVSILEIEMDKLEAFADISEEERLNAREGLEKLILKPLHQHFFRIDADDRVLDEALSVKIDQIAPLIKLHDHLHGPQELRDDSVLELAIDEMRKIDSYRAPRDKLQCILNAFRVIRHALDTAIGPSAWGADQLLPVCIYTIIRSNPPSLNSNVHFIASYRHPSRLRGEDEYLLMQMNMAIRDIIDIEEVLLKPVPDLTISEMSKMHKRLKKCLLRLVDDGEDVKWEQLLGTEWKVSMVDKFVETYREVVSEYNRRFDAL